MAMLTHLNKILFVSLAIVLASSAVRAAEVVFPISDLGSCATKEECRVYCDAISHKDACLTYASSHNLVDKKVVERQKQIIQLIKTQGGPGGCTTQDSCHAYCDQEANREE